MFSFQIFCFHPKESSDDGCRLFPTSGLGLQLSTPVACQAIEARLPVILGRAPFGRDRTLLLKLQQHWIQRALVERQKIPADLFDSPGDPVAMQRAQHIPGFEHHQRQRALSNVRFSFHLSIGFPTWSMTCSVWESNRTFFVT